MQFCSFSSCVLALALAATGTFAQTVPAKTKTKAESRNMELVGYHDLQGRSAYQPLVHRQGGRWIAYIGHHGGLSRNPLSGAEEPNGTSILDVTDPKSPRYLAHVPGEAGKDEAGGAQMVQVCDGSELPKGDKSKVRSEEHTSELQSRLHLVCRLLLEKKKKTTQSQHPLKA